MLSYVLAMSLVLAVAAGVVGVVVVGLEGRGRDHAPKTAQRLKQAGRHLNGEGEPPQRFAKLFH